MTGGPSSAAALAQAANSLTVIRCSRKCRSRAEPAARRWSDIIWEEVDAGKPTTRSERSYGRSALAARCQNTPEGGGGDARKSVFGSGAET
jgi:hypothetical protein